jgi:hypothetical protein
MEAYSHDNDCIAFPSVFVNVQQHLAGGYHCTGVPAANHFQTQTLIFVPCFATWRNVLTLLQIMYPAWATVRRIALFFFTLFRRKGWCSVLQEHLEADGICTGGNPYWSMEKNRLFVYTLTEFLHVTF